jgi:hypothetical protein
MAHAKLTAWGNLLHAVPTMKVGTARNTVPNLTVVTSAFAHPTESGRR